MKCASETELDFKQNVTLHGHTIRLTLNHLHGCVQNAAVLQALCTVL